MPPKKMPKIINLNNSSNNNIFNSSNNKKINNINNSKIIAKSIIKILLFLNMIYLKKIIILY